MAQPSRSFRVLWLQRVSGIFALGLLAACQLMIPANLEEISCAQDGVVGPPVCPENQVCWKQQCTPCKTGLCPGTPGFSGGSGGVAEEGGASGSAEEGGEGGGGDPFSNGGAGSGGTSEEGGAGVGGGGGEAERGGDAGEGGAGAGGEAGKEIGLGGICKGKDFCAKGLVRKSPDIWGESGPEVCTRACCNSSECNDGDSGEPVAVCMPTKTKIGGYCQPIKQSGRKDIGEEKVGAACDDTNKCRSGWCDNGVCRDLCCDGNGCGGNEEMTCTWGSVVNGSADAFSCQKNVSPQECIWGGKCYSNQCYFPSCLIPCTSKSSVGCAPFSACEFDSELGAKVCPGGL